jgi:hypothetical protein
MELSSRSASRLLRSCNCITARGLSHLARTGGHGLSPASQSLALLSLSRRNLSNSSSSHAQPENSLLSFASGSSSPSSGGPQTYFTQRSSLPANTVVRFVPQQTAWIVERMGKFHRILEPGLAILIPFLDRIAYVKSLKENAIEIPSQNAITADNVTLELDGVLYTRVFDAYKARYGTFLCHFFLCGLMD